MDSISLLVGPPPNASRALNQDDFDTRYNFAKYRKKKTNTELAKQFAIGDNWILYQSPNPWTQILAITTWINKYHVKDSLGKDLIGALYLSLLLLPQAIGFGVVINDVASAVYSMFIPQIIYAFFGSAQHSSLGALSFLSIMIYCSIEYSHSHLSSISLCCAFIQLMQFLLPLEFIFSYISTSALSGFSVGLFIRIVFRFLPQFLVFRGHDCKSTSAVGILLPNTTDNVKRVLQCFYAAVPCLRSADTILIVATVVAAMVFIIFKWRLSRFLISKIGFSAPHEFFVLLTVTLIIFFFQPDVASQASSRIDLSIPKIGLWTLPSFNTFLDSFAISIYAMTSHMQITKSIAEEKMYKVHRKQELFCFSIISILSSFFGLLPPSSSYGSSQINIESSKFSLVANVLSLIPTILMVHFGAPLFNALPICAIGIMVITSFNGWFSDLKNIREIFYSSTWDAAIAMAAIVSALIFPNVCTGFICMLFCSIFAVSLKVQFPNVEVLAKLSESHFAEENRYEGDCLDTPLRIIRLSGPLLSVNCESIRSELFKQAVVVKGLIGIGIGTRTASLRSQCPSAIGPKESICARESVNLSANITIIQECDVSVALPPSEDTPPIVRFLVLSMNGVTGIDKDMLTCLSQVYGDLSSENIKILLAGVPAFVRDSMELLGFYNTVPRTQFYPNVQEALLSARNTVLPFHMSVSMNGYRDVIALSCAASNADLNRQPSPEAV
ncbi:STAS domain-containing protein [Caenorhabditis elegans]|uniref:STAS domain-containing protein n=1 Tax=Caenorhabditis elegans TaxID=6239 RepID=A0A2K5ATL0_CAEEL|nr:STAS domain-containing protein [Caenorhabditis elegans]SPC47120.1 STAS domain-containing protein [Caenorhabditis elegans]|eukprot:NP_001348668.1 SULfate Permease family [Caenorhabditis elegans]